MPKIGEKEKQLRAMRETDVGVRSTAPLDATGARALTDRINRTAGDLWRLMLESYERKAWAVLGYDSWRHYATEEFTVSQSRAYQLLNQAKLIAALEKESGISTIVEKSTGTPVAQIPETHAREVAKLPDDEQAEAYQEAVDEAGGKPTAKQVAEVVQRRLEPEGDSMADAMPSEEDELEAANRRIQELLSLTEALQKDDATAEVARLHDSYARLENRLAQESRTRQEAENQARWAIKLLKEIAKEAGVEDFGDIVEVIRDFHR